MRPPVDARRLREFLERFCKLVASDGRLYLTGGATALLYGWRDSTVDIDLSFDPEPAGAFEAIRQLKDESRLWERSSEGTTGIWPTSRRCSSAA